MKTCAEKNSSLALDHDLALDSKKETGEQDQEHEREQEKRFANSRRRLDPVESLKAVQARIQRLAVR